MRQTIQGSFEIIVVDSGSGDGSVEYVRSLGLGIVNISPKEFGYAKAFNIAARRARGDYLVRLSGDVIPIGTTWLSHLLKPMKGKYVGAVYGKYVVSNRPGYDFPPFWPKKRFPDTQKRFSVKPTLTMGLLRPKPLIEKLEDLFSLAGGCFTIRKSMWESRPFNENLILAEDGEYAFFLHLYGYDIVYEPKAIVLHEHPRRNVREKKGLLHSYFLDSGISMAELVLLRENISNWLHRFILPDPYKRLRVKRGAGKRET